MPLTVSDAFKAAAGKLHRPTRRVVLTDADGDDHDLLIRSGSLSWTAGGYPSCQANIEVADLSDAPLAGNSWYKPYGSRVKVYAGIVLPSGWTEEVLVADLVVTAVVEAQPEQVLTLSAASDEELLRTDVFPQTVPRYAIDGATGVFQQLESIVWRTLPECSISVDDTLVDIGTTEDAVWDGDAWAAIEECLESLEAEAFFTPDRVLHIRTAAAVAGTPHDTITQGKASSTIVGATSTWNRDVNTVTVVGYDSANGDAEVSGSASRAGIQAPDGPMGPVRLVERRQASTTSGTLDDAAAGLLRLTSRRNRLVTVDTLPRPWLILGDTVRLVWADDTSEDLLVRSINLSLEPQDPMSLELAETWV